MGSVETLRSAAIAEVARRLASAECVLVVTGAGVSAESGVPTFRGPGGLWRERRPEQLATPAAFDEDPRLVWEWYAWRRGLIAPLRPNAAHLAIARIEARGREFLLATQNVDGLHELAGSRKLVELHGSLWRVRCTACGSAAEDRRVPLPELPPRCDCGGSLRPGVVWFGEALPQQALEAALSAASRADLVLVVGTSAVVHPAAALAPAAHARGAFVVEVNPEETPVTRLAHVALHGRAAELLPHLVEAA